MKTRAIKKDERPGTRAGERNARDSVGSKRVRVCDVRDVREEGKRQKRRIGRAKKKILGTRIYSCPDNVIDHVQPGESAFYS